MEENRCYDVDCEDEQCRKPEHYNYICFDPECEDIHCENSNHYDKQLLKDYQNSTDLSVHDHREEIDYDKDVDINLCACPDCADDEEHDHDHHGHDHDHHDHNHEHEHHHEHHHEHDHHGHDHDHNHIKEDVCADESCDCHDHDHHHDDDVEFSLCACPDCADGEDDHGHDHGHDHAHGDGELFAEGKPLIANRPIQIILASGILFVLGHIFEWLSFSPTIVTVTYMAGAIIAGYEIAILAYKSLVNRHTVGPAMLVCIACVASFIIGHPEEGAAVTFLYYIAEFLEDLAEHRAKRSIKSLVEIAPDTARVKVGDKEEIRNVDEVNIGDIVIVKPGDKVPLDGEVIFGSSSINQASITGESVPVLKEVGDNVFSGTVNEDGYLEIKVTTEAKDSVISKIVTLVKRSQLNRSETETLVERVAKYYTPIMMVAAICVAFIPPLLFAQNLVDWVYKALSLLVISCPCAFLISTPVGMVSAITSATRNGVIIKGSTYVEEMRNVKAVIFDKTGTLTEGKLKLSDVEVLDERFSKEEIVKIAASLESQSSHPIAKAIVNYANENNIVFDIIQDFRNVPGKGIVANINGEQFYAANESLIEGSSFDISRDEINKYSSEGKTLIFVGNAEKVLGIITVSDKIRDNASEVIADLKDQGVQTIMLTGDNKLAAKSVASEIGIDYVYSNLLPEDKLNILDTIRNKFGDVAMVGDGINDAPALARSNIGIAMGAAGSDVAIETADIALMQDDISKLPYLFALSRKTMGIIKQNISIAILVKLLCVILAIMGIITLMMSVGFGDLGLTILVILNSFRIGMVKDPLF
ncbi:cation-translocating P-type ATPase [Methanobrevibacter sp.]|uniref:heavy metal translocating P-type ATPase n=1 Tax=Methanobrevibacter sp. TaxID=66852 RepID=UPI0025F8A2C4|nr:cation-translocating P-type ATPase [Methanobrevibacter sp.]MBQ2665288.1 cadmium-translocating P-type ATPase [Methanobrevibacter sp.]